MIKQLWYVATSTLCLVDGYVPAVSLPRSHRSIVVQIWHAPGAIKKFGYQAVGTPAGRDARVAGVLCMHKGYDFVIAGMEGAVRHYTKAFDVPESLILPLGLPRMDYLVEEEFEQLRNDRFSSADTLIEAQWNKQQKEDYLRDGQLRTVLYAPTFRKGNSDHQWLAHSIDQLSGALKSYPVRIIVAGHPLECRSAGLSKFDTQVVFSQGIPTIDLLHLADYVITDYSTVAFEAGFVGKRVLFYVPDIEEYRKSPGLNIDPIAELPTISFTVASDIAEIITSIRPYDEASFRDFMRRELGCVTPGAIPRIVSKLSEAISSNY